MTSDQYRVDTSPDFQNLTFSSLYRGDVSAYDMCCDEPIGENKRHVRGVSRTDRYFARKNAARLRSSRLKVLRVSRLPILPYTGEDLIPIYLASNNTPRCDGGVDAGESLEDALMQKTRGHNEKVFREPSNVDAWVDFVKFQDEYLRLHHRRFQGRAGRAFVMEKKLAILERAILENPSSHKLVSLYLETAASHWDETKLVRVWERVVQKGRVNPVLWADYVTFSLARYASFDMTQAREAFAKAIKAISHDRFAVRGDKDAVKDLEKWLLRFIVRLCWLERTSGHTERGAAIFQAMVELNLFCPPTLRTISKQLKAFAAFWESGRPRVGDARADGWGQWYEGTMERMKEKQAKARVDYSASGWIDAEDEWDSASDITDEEGGMSNILGEDGARPRGQPLGLQMSELSDASDNERRSRSEGNGSASDWDEGSTDDELREARRRAAKDDDFFEPPARRDQEKFSEVEQVRRVQEQQKMLLRQWLQDEDERETTQWRPCRSLAEAKESEREFERVQLAIDDLADRVVMFEDVEPFLFRFTCSEVKSALASAFLEYVGCGMEHPLSPTTSDLAVDAALRLEDTKQVFLPETPDYSPEEFGLKKTDTLFSPSLCPLFRRIQDREHRAFITNAFELILRALPNASDIATDYVRFVFSQDEVVGRDTCMHLLRRWPTSLPLWCQYARGESSCHHHKEARKVYTTALSQCASMAPSSTINTNYHPPSTASSTTVNASCLPPSTAASGHMCLLPLHTEAATIAVHFVKFLLRENKGDVLYDCLHTLVSVTESSYSPPPRKLKDKVPISPLRLLKARKVYDERLTIAASFKDSVDISPAFVDVLSCYAYTEMFCNNCNIRMGITVFERALEIPALSNFPYLQEMILHAFVSFLVEDYSHVAGDNKLRAVAPPKITRHIASLATERFPNNPRFLSLLLEFELRRAVAAPLSKSIPNLCVPDSGPLVWLFNIQTELIHLSEVSSASIRIRNVIERALKQPRLRTCVVLWRVYIDFEIMLGEEKLAKRVFYRAIRECPWSKRLWLDSVRALRNVLSKEEIDEVLEMMAAKEIRVRQPLAKTQLPFFSLSV
eukprot:Rmarinus@m.19701